MWHTNPPTPTSLSGLCTYCSVGWPGVADKEDGQFPTISRLYHLHLFLHNSPPPRPPPTHLISDISYTFIRFYYWEKYNSQGARLNLKNKVISWNKSTKVGSQHSAKANNTASQLFLPIFLLLPPFFSGEREPANPMPTGNLSFCRTKNRMRAYIHWGSTSGGYSASKCCLYFLTLPSLRWRWDAVLYMQYYWRQQAEAIFV